MSKFLNHSEQIASYLDGQMAPGQMQEFEKQLHTDPVLRSEFELQTDIIHSIKDFRKTQLKARLDQVPVGAGPTTLIGVKVAAALIISGIVGLGAYLYLTSPDQEFTLADNIAPVEQLEIQSEAESQVPETLPLDEPVEETTSEKIAEPEIVKVPQSNSDTETETRQPQTQPAANTEFIADEEIPEPVINSPNLIDPNLDHTEVDESIDIPTAALAQDGLLDNNVVAVETARKGDDMFHYQYFSGKLYLYGDFRDNPYEILELNSANGKRLFIYYNNAYYKIADDQRQITPLVQLTDQDIIKKLEIIQANK
jgi:hypothetical protein